MSITTVGVIADVINTYDGWRVGWWTILCFTWRELYKWFCSHFLLIYSRRTVAEAHKYRGSEATLIDQEKTGKSARGFRRPKNKCYPFNLFWELFEDITFLGIKCFMWDSAVKARLLSFRESFLNKTAGQFFLDLVQNWIQVLALPAHVSARCLLLSPWPWYPAEDFPENCKIYVDASHVPYVHIFSIES